jgi:hypothetical protein
MAMAEPYADTLATVTAGRSALVARLRAIAEARHGARRHLEACVRLAVWQVALYRGRPVEGDADPTLGVHREAVGAALDADRRLGRCATGRVELVNE